MVTQDEDLIRDKSMADGSIDREAHPKFWIAAYTRPKSERKAAVELAKFDIETYVPVQRVTHQWSDRKKKIDVVVIPMFVFARISKEELFTVKTHRLIIKVLTFPGKRDPAKIPEDQIENLRLMLSKAEEPVEFVGKAFRVSESVRVAHGHLKGLEGIVERASDGKTYIIVSLDILGGAKVSVGSSDLEFLLS